MRILFWILFLPLYTQAVEYNFDLGEITATGEVTAFPAGLGWLSQNQFSASAMALEGRSYRFNNELLSSESAPLNLRPVSISSGLGRSWGGWSLLVSTLDQAWGGKLESPTSTGDFSLRLSTLTGQLGCGLLISPSWALGWSASAGQINTDSTAITISQPSTLSIDRQQSKTQFFRLGMGADYRGDLLTLGFHVLTPTWVLSSTEKLRSQSLVASVGSVTDVTTEDRYPLTQIWSTEVGVRFGHEGFVYMLSDAFQFSGTHTLKGGFEYVASWGTIASGAQYSHANSSTTQKILVGYAFKKGNFHWAVGPFLNRESSESTSGTNSQNYGVLYSSEISY